MKAQSDMERIIKVAEVFLDMDMKVQHSSSNFPEPSHPFFDSRKIKIPKSFDIQAFNVDSIKIIESIDHLQIFDILENPEALRLGKEIRRQQLRECETPTGLIWMITKEYRFQFLKMILNLLSEKDFAEVFRSTWTSSNITNGTSVFTEEELTDLFSKCVPEYLMSEEELEVLRNSPDRLTVYRGVNQLSHKKVRTFSWTLSAEVAEQFSNRFETDVSFVYQADINKKDVFAYFASAEEEIIVNPSKLKNIITL